MSNPSRNAFDFEACAAGGDDGGALLADAAGGRGRGVLRFFHGPTQDPGSAVASLRSAARGPRELPLRRLLQARRHVSPRGRARSLPRAKRFLTCESIFACRCAGDAGPDEALRNQGLRCDLWDHREGRPLSSQDSVFRCDGWQAYGHAGNIDRVVEAVGGVVRGARGRVFHAEPMAGLGRDASGRSGSQRGSLDSSLCFQCFAT